MKKLLLPFLCFMTVSLAAFELDMSGAPISINGYASLTWGFDIDTKANGFINAASLGMEFPILAKITQKAGGEGLYGEIQIEDLEWVFSQDSGSALSSYIGGSISARLTYNSFSLGIYGKPTWAFNKNVNITADNDGDILFTGFSDYSHGTTLSYMNPDVPVEVDLMISSENVSNWRENTQSRYCLGTNVKAFLFDYLVETRGSFAINFSPDLLFYGGFEIPLEFYLLEGFTVKPAIDFRYTTEFSFDTGLDMALHFSPKNNDDLSANLQAKAFWGRDNDLSLSLSFTEPTVEGLIDHLGFGVEGSIVDIVNSSYLMWSMRANAEYEILMGEKMALTPSVLYTLDASNNMSLKSILKWEIEVVDNTEISIGYYSGNFLGSPLTIGYVEAIAKLSL